MVVMDHLYDQIWALSDLIEPFVIPNVNLAWMLFIKRFLKSAWERPVPPFVRLTITALFCASPLYRIRR